jgi:hypothetical protein
MKLSLLALFCGMVLASAQLQPPPPPATLGRRIDVSAPWSVNTSEWERPPFPMFYNGHKMLDYTLEYRPFPDPNRDLKALGLVLHGSRLKYHWDEATHTGTVVVGIFPLEDDQNAAKDEQPVRRCIRGHCLPPRPMPTLAGRGTERAMGDAVAAPGPSGNSTVRICLRGHCMLLSQFPEAVKRL